MSHTVLVGSGQHDPVFSHNLLCGFEQDLEHLGVLDFFLNRKEKSTFYVFKWVVLFCFFACIYGSVPHVQYLGARKLYQIPLD